MIFSEFKTALKKCYFDLMNENLPIFEVPNKIESYRTTKSDVKKQIDKFPTLQAYREQNEDIYTTQNQN